jgi:hypothetical protein
VCINRQDTKVAKEELRFFCLLGVLGGLIVWRFKSLGALSTAALVLLFKIFAE